MDSTFYVTLSGPAKSNHTMNVHYYTNAFTTDITGEHLMRRKYTEINIVNLSRLLPRIMLFIPRPKTRPIS